MRYKLLFLPLLGVALAGCSGIFSGSKTAYIDDSQSLPRTHNTSGVVLKKKRQYFPAQPVNTPRANYQTPSMLPPGEGLIDPAKKKA